MRKTVKISIFATFLLIGVMFNIGSASAIKSTSANAIADTYARSDQSAQNYGTSTKVTVGHTPNYLTNYSGYFRFSLSNQPSNLIKTEILLNINNHYSGSDTQIIKVSLIEESWDESTLTYDNRPNLGVFITNLSVTTDGFYSIDITQYVNGRINFSIGLEGYGNLTYGDVNYGSIDDYIEINSRENLFDSPRIVWTYDDPMDVILVIITIIAIAGAMGAAGAAIILYRKRVSASYEREPATPYEQGMPERRTKKSDKICWYCEKAIPKGFNVCPNCGAELE